MNESIEETLDVVCSVLELSNMGRSMLRKQLVLLVNETIVVAAQLAEDIDSGKYTATKTAAEAIRAMKVKV